MIPVEQEPDCSSEAVSEKPSAIESGEKFISFELGGRFCCVAASGVAEVVQPIPVALVPNSPSWLLGLGPYRGEPVAVINPKTVVETGSKTGGKSKVIVFRKRRNEIQFALPIDSLHEMIVGPAFQSGSLAPDGKSAAECIHGGQTIRLIEHERFFNSFGQSQR